MRTPDEQRTRLHWLIALNQELRRVTSNYVRYFTEIEGDWEEWFAAGVEPEAAARLAVRLSRRR